MEPLSLGQKKPKKEALPKLIDDSKRKNVLVTAVNNVYGLFFIVRNFCKKFLWFGSCMGLMYLFPMMIEYTSEQTRILDKIQRQMGDTMMGGPPQMPPM